MKRASHSSSLRNLPPIEILFGRSSQMTVAREKLERVAETAIPVLLQGESGTGKDLFAKLLHAYSNRSQGALVKVACPAIPHSLLESELFGYEKGAFTGAYATKAGRVEQAHRGTLFLDEIGDLDLSVQAKLLEMIQDGNFIRVGGQDPRNVDIRLVSAASEDLRQQTEKGNFRLDLFFRINAVTIELPPLRQRAVDLPMLIEYFLDWHAKDFHRSAKPLSREVMQLMQQYNWPGNIRQLENMIRSHILIGDEKALVAEMASSGPVHATEPSVRIDLTTPVSLKEITKAATHDLERQIILAVLKANGWNRRKTAKWLNISYRSLLYKLQDSQAGGVTETLPKATTVASISIPPGATATKEIQPMWTGKTSN